MQIARWIEEMSSEPMPAKINAAFCCQHGEWNARCVGRDDRAEAPHRIHLGEQRLFDVDLLDDRLDNPVGVTDSSQIGIESTGFDPTGDIGGEERIWFQLACAFQSFGCD